MRELFVLICKDLRLLVRDRAGFVVTFVFPFAYALFFGVIFAGHGAGTGQLTLLVTDEDGSEFSQRFIESLSRIGAIEVIEVSRDDANERLNTSGSAGAVVIPRRVGAGLSTEDDISDWKIEFAPGRTNSPAGKLLPIWLERCVEASLGGAEETPKTSDLTPSVHGHSERWIRIVNAPHSPERKQNHYERSFPQGIIWGVLGCTATFGLSLVTERTRGTLTRLRVAPIRRAQILASKGGACFITSCCLAAILFAIAHFLFNVQPQSYGLLALAVVSMAAGFVGIMMLLSVLGKTEQTVGGVSWAALLGMAMLGGGMVPHFFMPPWLQQIGAYTPVRWSILAMEGAVWRGFDVAEMLQPCAFLLAIGVVCFGLGTITFRWQTDN